MIKVINKDKEYKLEYYELLNFCKFITEELIQDNSNKQDFFKLKKEYSYYEPYFDYIFGKNTFTMHNPLYIENTKLISKNNKYIIKKDNEDYNFTYTNDHIIGLNNLYKVDCGFIILEDGTILDNSYVERHVINARNILNQYLIRDKETNIYFKKYIKNDEYNIYKIVDFLIEEKAMIYGRKNGNLNIELTININKLTKEQLKTISKLKRKYKIDIKDYNELDKYNQKKYFIKR